MAEVFEFGGSDDAPVSIIFGVVFDFQADEASSVVTVTVHEPCETASLKYKTVRAKSFIEAREDGEYSKIVFRAKGKLLSSSFSERADEQITRRLLEGTLCDLLILHSHFYYASHASARELSIFYDENDNLGMILDLSLFRQRDAPDEHAAADDLRLLMTSIRRYIPEEVLNAALGNVDETLPKSMYSRMHTAQEPPKSQVEEVSPAILGILALYAIKSKHHFEAEIDARAGTYACVYDCKNQTMLSEYGNSQRKCDLFSITKSLTALVIVHDTMYGPKDDTRIDIHENIGGLMKIFYHKRLRDPNNPPPANDAFDGLTLAMLMNHVAGIDSIQLNAKNVIDLILCEKNTQDIIGRYLTHFKKNAPFKYSPVLGYAIVGCVYELLKGEGTYIKQRCFDVFLKNVWQDYTWHWETDSGADICEHTFAFSEVFATGENMKKLGISLLRNHRAVLEYILDDTKPYPCYVRDANHLGASSYGGHEQSDEHKTQYDYSMGWWIIRYSKTRRYLVAIGWLGQFLVIGVDDEIVAVRQHELGQPVRDPDVRRESSLKKALIPNHHEHFPIHVISFIDHLREKTQ